jgi:transcriptional regulator with XRE-family HTH domain
LILFSNNLKYLRSKKGLKQSDLAEKLDVKTNTISNYENGISQPDFKILEKIVKIFEIQSADLLFTDLSSEKNKTYSELPHGINIVSEPKNTEFSTPLDTCKNCTDKERIIKALQATIEELRNDKAYLKEEIKELKDRLKK